MTDAIPPIRGKVLRAVTRDGRALLDVQTLDGERRSRVELMMPAGMSALPRPGADVLLLAVGGHYDDLIAAVADDTGTRVPGLAAGEFGFRDAQGQQVVFRAGGLEISGALKVTIVSSGEVVVQAPTIRLGSAGAAKRVKLEDGSNATKVFGE